MKMNILISEVYYMEEIKVNLQTLIFTKNLCYTTGKKQQPRGIMVHSTGANNPWLKRYVGPDDGFIYSSILRKA